MQLGDSHARSSSTFPLFPFNFLNYLIIFYIIPNTAAFLYPNKYSLTFFYSFHFPHLFNRSNQVRAYPISLHFIRMFVLWFNPTSDLLFSGLCQHFSFSRFDFYAVGVSFSVQIVNLVKWGEQFCCVCLRFSHFGVSLR